MIPKKLREILERQQYRAIGNNSAVKVCKWTKESIRGNGFCYKQKFYGINSHRCLQMTPCLACNFSCLFCWRTHPQDLGIRWDQLNIKDWDEPKGIIDDCIERQRELLSGFKGDPNIDIRKWEEAQNPNQAAISLSGEPTLYPRLGELIKEFHKRNFTTFLVTNGSKPKRLESLEELPTQLYMTLPAPDRKTYLKTCRPLIKNGWERINKTLELFPSLDTRKVMRLTLVKELNLKNPKAYAKLIKKAKPNFVECKGFVSVGYARKRLPYEAMPLYKDILNFTEELAEELGCEIKGKFEPSRVTLIPYNWDRKSTLIKK